VAPPESLNLYGGCAKAHVQLIWDATRFNNGLPNITFSVAGKKVWDPRLSPPAYAYSTNAALCLYDFLTDTKFGMAVDPSIVDQSLLITAANVCDEAMALREGGFQPRYECNGVIEATVNRGDVVQKLLDAMSGTLVPPGDLWQIYAGIGTSSVLSITDSDLRGPIKIDTAVSRKDLVNGVKGTFISPDNNWQSADYPPYVNSTYVVDDGGTVTLVEGLNSYTGVVFSDLALDFVSDSIQAQRLAKIRVEKLRRKNPLILPCKMMAYPVQVHDVVTFTHARWGLTAATYEVVATALVFDDKGLGPTLGYDLTCLPTDSAVYEWDPDVDEGTVTIVTAPLLPDNTNVGAPTGVGSPPVLGLESDSSTTITRADGIAHSQIKVTWTAPTDAHVLNGGYIEIFIKKVSDPIFDFAGSVAGNITVFFIDKNIVDGIDYDVMIQSLNAAGSHSEGLSGSIVCSGSASSIVTGGGAGPVGVANNDFEASSSLPPVSWDKVGTPTLDYEISSQQQGIRSLKVTSSVQYEGVRTHAKYEVVPGDMYTGEQYKVGGFLKGDGTGHGAIVFRFFDATDTEVGTPVIADGGNPTPASWNFYSAVGPVYSGAVYARVYLQNMLPTSVSSPPTTTLLEFDSIVLFRVASLEDEVVNGPSRGAITAANSSYRPLTNPLSSHDDGLSGSPPADHVEIDIAAFTMRSSIGPTDMAVHSGVITGLLPSTTYHVYYDDPTYAGGAVTYFANTDQAVALDAEGRFYVGSILTPITGGLPTVGNNDGGTGAQSGQTYILSPTLRANYDANNNQTWYPANAEETDGDTSTFHDLTIIDTIWLGGIPTIQSKWTSLKLKLHSEVLSVAAGGAAFCDYSVDDGATWTNKFNVVYGSDTTGLAGAGANDGGAGTAWTNPSNVADPTNYATITALAHGSKSQNVKATNFTYVTNVPLGSAIDGITVLFDEIDAGSAEPLEQSQFTVQMLKAGTPVGTPKTVNGLGTGTIRLGNNADLWGTTWADVDPADTNFGFEIQAVTPTALNAWAATTYYSPMAMIIDSNGNYQIVVTAGTSGGSAPTWATTLAATTTEGPDTLEWAVYQHGSTWSAGQIWNPGDPNVAPNGSEPNGNINTPHFITATAAGTSCVFELTAGSMPRLGNTATYIWRVKNQGYVDFQYPMANPPSAPKVFAGASQIKSLYWHNTIPYTNGNGFYWYAINGDGTLGVGTAMGEDSSSTTGGWEGLQVGQMQFPGPGTWTFQLWHDDGMIIAFDPAKTTKLSGTLWNVNASSRSPVYGFPWQAGQNASTNYSGNGETAYNGNPSYFTFKVLAPMGYDGVSPIVVDYELGYMNWEHSGRMQITCADVNGVYQNIVPVSTPIKTGTTTPAWPAWTPNLSPKWPSVADASGNFIWVNRGPATDFAWHASTFFTAADTTVVDANGFKESPYRAGVSGGTAPSWSIVLNARTNDGSSLVWLNDGGYTATTSFDFSVRNATVPIAYLPPGAANTRGATTDEITLGLNQNLGLIQLRYGLINNLPVNPAGEILMYEVWVEATAG